ncbi:MAG: CRTAC1 family protein [Bryobacteraceae bacterium]
MPRAVLSSAALLLLLLPLILISQNARSRAASVQFVDATARSGLSFHNRNSATPSKYLIETMTGGVALLDYDGDGWLDVFFTNGAKLNNPQKDGEALDKTAPEFWNRLYRNKRDGTFEDGTEKAGVRGTGYGMGAAVADFDNDGYSDLLVTNLGGALLYHNNGDGTFSDVTAKAGLENAEGWLTSAGFFDYDRDGHLDLFICRYLKWTFSDNIYCGSREPGGRSYCHPDNFQPISNLLYRNNGDGTFTDVSTSSKIAESEGKGLGVAFADFDNDGWMDISVANDSFPQFLFRNNTDGTFTETAMVAGAAYDEDGKTFAGMGTDASDVNGDGLFDIVTTTLSNECYAYFRNNGDGSFAYATHNSGLGGITRLFAGWGVRVFDFDLDGRKDLFFANSHVMDNVHMTQPHIEYEQPPLLLRVTADKFVNVSAGSGSIFSRPLAARGAAAGDLDNDGDPDLVIASCNRPAVYLQNEGGSGNAWIGLRLRGTKSNRDGIGSKVTVTGSNGRMQHFMVTTAAGYQSAQDQRLYAGLGKDTGVEQVRITWPSGTTQVLAKPSLGKLITVEER